MAEDVRRTRQEEVDRNYEAFNKMLPQILAEHRGKYALMKNGEILGYYSTPQDAAESAEKFIPDRLYSIQQVTNASADLGYYSHAVSLLPV
jgi:hypothetical protein